jgi:mono/diheme cytochrome c family protein
MGAVVPIGENMTARIGTWLTVSLTAFVVACACLTPASCAEGTTAPAASGDAAAQVERGSQACAANGCGWCHQNGGRAVGRGPQLMDDPHDDDFLMSRIATGSPGRMPAFGQALPFEDIQAIIAYIRNLKP